MDLESARSEGEGFSWVHLTGHNLEMSVWGHSSVSVLTDAGVISSDQDLSVFPDVLVNSSLLDEITMTTSVDVFLSKVLCRVQGLIRSPGGISVWVLGGWFSIKDERISYHVSVCRMSIVWWYSIELTVIVCWWVILGWSVRIQVLLVRTGGQVCIVMCHILCDRVGGEIQECI